MAKLVQTKEAVDALRKVRDNLKLLSEIKECVEGADRNHVKITSAVTSGGKSGKINMTGKYAGKMLVIYTELGKTVSKDTAALAEKYSIELDESEKALLI